MAGYETQNGAGISTSSPSLTSANSALAIACFAPTEMTTCFASYSRPCVLLARGGRVVGRRARGEGPLGAPGRLRGGRGRRGGGGGGGTRRSGGGGGRRRRDVFAHRNKGCGDANIKNTINTRHSEPIYTT